MKKMILMSAVILSTSFAFASRDTGARVSCGKSAEMTLTSNKGKVVARTETGRTTTGQNGQN